MAGIYLHIPFCKSRCIYCDFYSTTKLNWQEDYVKALIIELIERKEYLKDPIKTIYFGGGTPSLLNIRFFDKIFNTLYTHYNLSQVEEITIESNPNDLTNEHLKNIQKFPFNRLSIGIQSFHDNQLKKLNRRHTAHQAINTIKLCQENGFNNISIDLIYGIPNETKIEWIEDLEQAIALNIQHISAYHLIYEENTPLYKLLKNHKITEVNENLSVKFFSLLIEKLREAGFEHYEISNFCKPNFQSKHNSSYWDGTHYLGCGPSAHSFNGVSREWNVSSLTQYIQGLKSKNRIFEKENLDLTTQYNDYIITSIRRNEGANLNIIKNKFGSDFFQYCIESAQPHLKSNTLRKIKNNLILTQTGIFISDGIISDLLFIN